MKNEKVSVFVSGCTGKLGSRVVEAVNNHPGWEVCGGFGRKENRYNFPVFDYEIDGENHNVIDFFDKKSPNLIIDCSTSELSVITYNFFACGYLVPMVCATTKLLNELLTSMKQDNIVPVFQAYNLLRSMKIFTKQVCEAAVQYEGYDIQINESHHSGKQDIPSGTANNLAEAINSALGGGYEILVNTTKPRAPRQIRINSIREGDDPGTHEVIFVGNGEKQRYIHEVYSKDVFAIGAVKAAEFLLKQSAGYYTMDDLV